MTQKDTWELINPEGIVHLETVDANPHADNLEGKTVLLRWNGKHNGDLFLDRIGELLSEKIRDVKIVKAWEAIPESRGSTSNAIRSKDIAKQLAQLKPDISIGVQGD